MTIPHPLSPHYSSGSPSHSPNSTYRRSLAMDEPDYPYAYDFPFYSASASSASSSPSPLPATNPIPVPPAFTHHKPPVARSTRTNNASAGSSTSRNRIRDTSPSASSQSPPPSSARFVHGYPITTVYPGTASTSSSSSSRNRARGPSFASTTSYASTSTASSSSSGGPATPPRSGYTLSLSSPTRTFRPYWETERPHSHLGEDVKCRLDEEGEDVPQDVEEGDSTDEEEFGYGNSRSSFDYSRYASSPLASLSLSSTGNRKPRSVRRSPFADTDPAAPYSHVYLDEDIVPQQPYGSLNANTRASSPGARRLSRSSSLRRRTESPRSVARSVSLSHSHSQSRASPRRPHTPVLASYSRPQSPALSSHSNSHTPSFEQDPLETSFELDTSPLRTALLLNPNTDGEHDRDLHQQEAERRFSGRGLGLGLGSVNGSVNVALARRRAEWTEFEGDEYSSARPVPPFREDEEGGVESRRGALNLDLTYDGDVDLSSPRPSFSHPYARVASPIGEKRRSYPYAYGGVHHTAISDDEGASHVAEASDKEAGASEGGNAWNQGEDVHVPTCFAFRWGVRARWAALKLRVRLGAFRARRRVGLA